MVDINVERRIIPCHDRGGIGVGGDSKLRAEVPAGRRAHLGNAVIPGRDREGAPAVAPVVHVGGFACCSLNRTPAGPATEVLVVRSPPPVTVMFAWPPGG